MPEEPIFRPIDYNVEITVGAQLNDVNAGDVAINDRPFVLVQIRHMIVADGRFPAVPTQDGLYRIDWSLFETTRFFKGAVPPADVAFGSIRHGIWIPLKTPITIEGQSTIHAAVQNMWGPRPAPFTVHLEFSGAERVDPRKAG